MSYKVWNTALDHSKAFLHRRASKMQMEPIVAGVRLRMRQSIIITNAQFDANKTNLELYKSWGIVDWEEVGAGSGPFKPPTMKEILDAGYSQEAAKEIYDREQADFKAGRGVYGKKTVELSMPKPPEEPKSEPPPEVIIPPAPALSPVPATPEEPKLAGIPFPAPMMEAPRSPEPPKSQPASKPQSQPKSNKK